MTPLLVNSTVLIVYSTGCKITNKTPSTYTNNLLVGRAGHKQVLFVLVRVELDAVGHLPTGEPRDTVACNMTNLKVTLVRQHDKPQGDLGEAT